MSITHDDLRAALFAQCEHLGGIRPFARAKGLSPSLVSETLSGAREPSETIANAVGFTRLVSYIPIKGKVT